MQKKMITLPPRINISAETINNAQLKASAGTIFLIAHGARKIEYFHYSEYQQIEMRLSRMNVDRREFPKGYWSDIAQNAMRMALNASTKAFYWAQLPSKRAETNHSRAKGFRNGSLLLLSFARGLVIPAAVYPLGQVTG